MSPNNKDARKFTSFEKGHWRTREEARQNAGPTSLVDMVLPFSSKRRSSNAVCRLLAASKDTDSIRSEMSTEETTTSLTISPIMVFPSEHTRSRGVPSRSSEDEGQTDAFHRNGSVLVTNCNIPLNLWNLEESEIRTGGSQRRNFSITRNSSGSNTRSSVHESSLHESDERASLCTNGLPTKSAHLETKSDRSSHNHHGTTKTTPTTPRTMNTTSCHENQSPTGSLKRSRAITIKRTAQPSTCYSETNSSELEHVAAEEESNTRMYDMATWRMYNRIVDHRKHQIFTNNHSSEESARRDQMGYPISQSLLVSELSTDYLQDEVFELEM